MAISGKDLRKRGWQPSPAFGPALDAARVLLDAGKSRQSVLRQLDKVRDNPDAFADHETFGALAAALAKHLDVVSDKQRRAEARAELEREGARDRGTPVEPDLRPQPIPYRIWGRDGLDAATLRQMDVACRLPVTVAAAQMPDGHVGYGLPIGGVLATRGAVIPYAVGVDIACRMKISIVPESASRIDGWSGRLRNALLHQTAFGIACGFNGEDRRDHAVMDESIWRDGPAIVRGLRDRAWTQLGSSGSGNHFVEWGELELPRADLGLAAGRYIALLSHSGSRGLGAQIAGHFTRIARKVTRLPKEAMALAWLPLDSEPGEEYWRAMELAGRYASANHELIHRHVLRDAGFEAAVQVENHHNFAWREAVEGEELVVHRKGATPAGAGVLGVIPGSMADPGYIVRGRGEASSLNSAAHGAGRRMSRKAATESITGSAMRKYLAERQVELLSAGLDEAPQAYKAIDEVMAAQRDLVEIVATFHPRIVRMAPGGKAED